MNDRKQTLVALLTALTPLLPLPLRVAAFAILALLKKNSVSLPPEAPEPEGVRAAPQNVQQFVAKLFDQLIAALDLDDVPVFARAAGLIKRYVLTKLTDKAWDTLAEQIGIGFVPQFRGADAEAPQTVAAVAPVDDEEIVRCFA